jgi:hypothetical protein
MSDPKSDQRDTDDMSAAQANPPSKRQVADAGVSKQHVHTHVEPVRASFALGAIAAIIFGSMFFTEKNPQLFNLQLLVVILVISLLATVWLSYLIAGPAVAQLRGKLGDFAVDVGGPIAVCLGTAVLLFYGHVYLLKQLWSQLPEQDPVKLKEMITQHAVYREVIPTQETLKQLSDLLEKYPPADLERVTAQYSYLEKKIEGIPDVEKIGDLILRSEEEKRLRRRVIGPYCYFSRLDGTVGGQDDPEYLGRVGIEQTSENPFIRLTGRSVGFMFKSDFFAVNSDGMLYQWSVEEEAGGRQVSIGFAKLSFTEFASDEDRAVMEMKGKFTTFDNLAGEITLVRNVGGGGVTRDYCEVIAPKYGYGGRR